jgi:hypothetical protein
VLSGALYCTETPKNTLTSVLSYRCSQRGIEHVEKRSIGVKFDRQGDQATAYICHFIYQGADQENLFFKLDMLQIFVILHI